MKDKVNTNESPAEKGKKSLDKIQKGSNFLIKSTVRIECTLKSGFESSGTGFIFDFSEDTEQTAPVIVTNKHVIENSVVGSLKFNAVSKGKPFIKNYELSDFESLWIQHPDKEIDLAILPLKDFIDENNLIENDIQLDFFALYKSICPTEEENSDFGAIEPIIMIGYPDGLMDDINCKPIARLGITATDIKVDYEGRKEFLIDVNCFGGSSGSPIFHYTEGAFIKEGKIYLGNSFKLLGILSEGFDFNIEGGIKREKVKLREFTNVDIPFNIVICIKVEKIFDFLPIL